MVAAPVSLGIYSTVGEVFTLPELQKIYDISTEEAQSFRAFARIYPKGSTIIREGDTDKTLYLLRGGSVGIYKQVGEEPEMIAQIDAVNFVGEMSCITDEPRTATVMAITDQVLVYAITTPNFSLILSNPKWADILITRFSKDLSLTNTHLVTSSERVHELVLEVETLKCELAAKVDELAKSRLETGKLINIVLSWMRVVRDQAVIGSKGWHFVKLATESVERIARGFFPALVFDTEKILFSEIREDLDAAQKSDTRSNLGPVYDEIRKGFGHK